MRILVLDTIHGGTVIAGALQDRGHFVDMVDVYRGEMGISPQSAEHSDYDLIIAPVHLDPGYPLFRSIRSPVISHHQAVKWILGEKVPHPFIEITGARGKTTTAHALAHLMRGPGVLQTSMGTIVYPSQENHGHSGITPASLINAATLAYSLQGWMIAEISLGFIGSGQLGILTSMETYPFSGRQKDALDEKLQSGRSLQRIITPPGTNSEGNRTPADEIAHVDGDICRYSWEELRGEFRNPLFTREAYHDPLIMATAAACIMGIDPSLLSTFVALVGRMAISWVHGTAVIDDSNSGTCAMTARQAIRLVRQESGRQGPLTLVIGKEEGAICEGFPAEDIAALILSEVPDRVILVGQEYRSQIPEALQEKVQISFCDCLADGEKKALGEVDEGMVVLAVKTWR